MSSHDYEINASLVFKLGVMEQDRSPAKLVSTESEGGRSALARDLPPKAKVV